MHAGHNAISYESTQTIGQFATGVPSSQFFTTFLFWSAAYDMSESFEAVVAWLIVEGTYEFVDPVPDEGGRFSTLRWH